jgi:hypothetical protein
MAVRHGATLDVDDMIGKSEFAGHDDGDSRERFSEPPSDRLPASEESLSCERAFGIAPFAVDRAMVLDYLADVRETEWCLVRGFTSAVRSTISPPSTSGNASRCGRRSHRMWFRRDIRLSNSMPL